MGACVGLHVGREGARLLVDLGKAEALAHELVGRQRGVLLVNHLERHALGEAPVAHLFGFVYGRHSSARDAAKEAELAAIFDGAERIGHAKFFSSAEGPYMPGTATSFMRRYTPSCAR